MSKASNRPRKKFRLAFSPIKFSLILSGIFIGGFLANLSLAMISAQFSTETFVISQRDYFFRAVVALVFAYVFFRFAEDSIKQGRERNRRK